MPDVSVIIPNCNGVAFLSEAIDSALSQADVNVEVIVVDDGSTDDSGAVINSYGERIRAYFQENMGAAAARNRGLAEASASMILFLDSDDQLYPGALKALTSKLVSQDSNIAVYGYARWISSPDGSLLRHDDTCLPKGMNRCAALIGQNILTGRVLHRAESLRQIGGFDVDLPRGQEFDLHFRLALSGVSFVLLEQDVLYYRVHCNPGRISAGGFSGEDPNFLLGLNAKHKSLLDQAYGAGQWPKLVNRRMAQRQWEIGRGLVREGNCSAALAYFNEAKDLAPNCCLSGKVLYRCLYRLSGPIRAERLLIRLRALLRPPSVNV